MSLTEKNMLGPIIASDISTAKSPVITALALAPADICLAVNIAVDFALPLRALTMSQVMPLHIPIEPNMTDAMANAIISAAR